MINKGLLLEPVPSPLIMIARVLIGGILDRFLSPSGSFLARSLACVDILKQTRLTCLLYTEIKHVMALSEPLLEMQLL